MKFFSISKNRNIFQRCIFLLMAVGSSQSYSQCTTSVNGYSYFKKITIDETKVSGASNHTNIPVLISHTDPDLRTTANGGDVQNANGWDIIFTDAYGSQIDYQRQKYVATTGEIIAWVEVPSLSSTVNTDIYIYFGNASVVTDPSTTAAWNTNYKGVWHLEEDPSGGAPQMLDGTANSNNLTTYGTMLTTQEVSAKIENGTDLDGTNDYISRTYDADFDFGTGSFSAGAWFKTAGGTPGPPVNFSKRIDTGNDDVEEYDTGVMALTSSDLEMADDDGEVHLNQKVGLRFTGITIPQGATINSATIDFYAKYNEINPTNLTFTGENIDNAPVFTTAASNLSSRTFTSASVAWNSIPAWTDDITYTTPDIKTIVQEIVNRIGWTSGNAVVFKVEGSGLVSETRRAEAYEGIPAVAAFLQINYTPPLRQYIVSRYDNDRGFKLWLDETGKIHFGVDDDPAWNPDYSVTTAGTYSDNLWHYAVGVKNDNSSIALYVDGVSQGSTAITGNITLDVSVSASSDDAEQDNATGAVSLTSSDLEIIRDGTIDQTVGIRFNGITVPPNTTIDSALIEFTVNATTNIGSPTITIKCENVDNAATFTTAAFDITGRPTTVASTSWSPPNWTTVGAKERTSDIKAPVQEVVNRAGWASGNSLAFIITGPTNTKRAAEAWNGVTPPRLLIYYRYNLTSSSAPLTIGSDEPTNNYYLDGIIDEVRVSNTNPSSDRITTEYNSQNSPATFYSTGIKKTIYYWTGATNTDWNTPSNWTPAGPPGSDNTAVIQNVANDPVLNVNAAIGLLYIQSLGVFNGGSNTLTINTGLINDGTFTPASGTVNYGASGSQQVCHNTYYNLTFSGSGTKELTTATAVSGNLAITGTATLDVTTNNYALNVTGNWSNSSTSNFTARQGTVTFNGTTSDQSVTSAGDAFYNLTINNTAFPGSDDIFLIDALDVNNNLTITDGDLNANGYNIATAGNWNNTGGSFTHGSANSVTFDGTSADQSIRSSSSSFFNLIINNTASAGNDDILPLDPLIINNDLTLTDGDLNANGFNFTIYGNWSRTGGSFTPGANSVSFLGTATQNISSTSGETFYNLIINNTSAASTITLNNPVTITNTLTLTDGHIITTTANILKLGINAAITLNGTPQENSFVKGPMIHTAGSTTTGSVDVSVSASSDDAEENNATGAVSISSSDLEIIRDGTIDQTIGIRFNGITIPNNSTIDSARIEFTVNATSNIGSPTITIKCENVDNAATFTTAAFNITGRPTTASTSWTPPNWTSVGAKERTSDIKAPVQEVINRAGWASGNSLAFIITGPTNTKRAAESWNGVTPPRLLIYYRTDAGTLTKIYPVGAGSRYRRADLNIDQNGAIPTEYTCEQLNSSATALGYTLPATLNRVSGISYWTLTKGAGASVNSATVKLYYESGDQVDIAADLRVAKDDGAGNWLDLGGSGTGAPSGTITSGSFTAFSKFSLANWIGGAGNPLPIELLSFTAGYNNKKVKLNWTTTTEINNDYFLVERSEDGKSFTAIGKVSGAGNSSTLRNYEFVDTEPPSTINHQPLTILFYRLKQTDFNGQFSYSKIVSVNISGSASVQIYPNPASSDEDVHLSFAGFDGKEILITLYNALGENIYSAAIANDADSFTHVLKLPDLKLSNGIYFITVSNNNEKFERQKLVVR